jgi:predicted dehydrogenase
MPDSALPSRMRIGVIGAGLIARQAHVPAVLALPETELAALIDLVPERAKAIAEEYGVRPVIASRFEDVADRLDAVIITTPNNTHAPLARSALEAGLHVLIEKPLATTVRDAEAIVEASSRTGRCLAVGYTTRFRDSVLLLERLLEQGYFGAPTRYAYQFGTPGGWSSLSAYSLSREATGGGVLMVTGTHFIDRALRLFGLPVEYEYNDDGDGGPEANAIFHVRHSLGGLPVTGAARFSKTVRLPAGFAIETEDGLVMMGESDESDLVWRPRRQSGSAVDHVLRGAAPANAGPRLSVFERQLRNFAAACRGEAELLVDGQQALLSLRFIAELYARRTPLSQQWYAADPATVPAR